MKLRTIAHSRSGDKGTIVNVSLIAFESRYYPALVEHVTAARVKEHFIGLATGEVVRYELPLIGALNFVVHGMVGGTVINTGGTVQVFGRVGAISDQGGRETYVAPAAKVGP